MPRIHPKTWEEGVMPLDEFPQWQQDEIAEAVAADTPPTRWIGHDGLFQMESRAWLEWHWTRGKRLRWTPGSKTRRSHIPEWLRHIVYARDDWKCVHCGAREPLSLDHIYPWSLGGPDTEDNLQTLCRPCNSRKGARIECPI